MPLTAALDPATSMRRRLETVARVRWIGVVFGLLQIAMYATLPYPDGVEGAGFTVVGAFAVLGVVFHVVLRRSPDQRLRLLAVTSVALDLLALSTLVWLFAFDPVSALFALLVLVPIEAALFFGLRGAMWAWAATAVSYTGREWYGTLFDNPWEPASLTYRVGLIFIVALVVGLLARDLDRQRAASAAALVQSRRAHAWRGRLVAVLAHDLRSPLAGARTGLATLRQLDDELSVEERRRIVDGGIRQIDRMLAMTRDLLDMARAEDGHLVLNPGRVRLAGVVTRAVDLVGPASGDVVLDVSDDIELEADGERLEQVVSNLLANALRHGAPPVEVTAQVDEGWVRLDVRDHGPGLPAELRDRVFEPFATSDAGSGVGLGSWVVAHLVGLHGGRVDYADADPGARFTVWLPGARVTAPAA